MIKDQLTVYELLLDMIKGKTGHIGKVTYTPQKPRFSRETPLQQTFPRCTPEEQGISSRYLAAFLQEVAGKKETDIHSIMVLKNGHVIGEFGFAPYTRGIWHIGHSMCKSITGMAIGLLIEEGKLKLDDKIVKLFGKRSFIGNVRQKNITVEHLLTMTSGVAFNELGIVSGDDWVKGYLDSNVSGAPGVRFEYNSMNTYMLSAIVTELTGMTLVEYLTPRLFEPLGITKFFWESCPKGITKGGWGLFLCQEDAAKLGQLYLNRGKWNGVQIIPEDWVVKSTTKQVDTPPEMGYHGYGYQIWMGGREGSFNFNGMLGQNVVVYPDIHMVLVTNAGSDELFQNCILLNIVRKYFEKDFMPPEALPQNLVSWQYLQMVQRQMELGRGQMPVIQQGGWTKRNGKRKKTGKRTPERQMQMLDGRDYELLVQQAGIFPLIMQVFHNNFTDGIKRVGFRIQEGKNWLLLQEGEEILKLEIGLGTAAVSEICIHEEPYLVAVKGIFTRDEEEQLVLKLDIAYLEEAVRRKIKFVFTGEEGIEVCFNETPGKNLIMEGLGGMLQAASTKVIFGNLMEFGNIFLPELLVDRTICPVIEGKLVLEQPAKER